MADASLDPLDDWVVTIAAELGLDPTLVGVDAVLDLAAAAAHNVVRPAAPLTTFMAGLAAGRSGGSAEDVRAAIARATQACLRAGIKD